MSFATLAFASSIPVSVASNVTIYKDGICAVYHPAVSSYLPTATSLLISLLNVIFFMEPLFRAVSFKLNSRTRSTAFFLFLTNLVSVVSTVLFHISLQFPEIAKYAPLNSSLDLMVNHVMLILPYMRANLKARRQVVPGTIGVQVVYEPGT
ncbi:hypothetical protein HK102_004429, partial [Quaeritorhiza haematococci]